MCEINITKFMQQYENTKDTLFLRTPVSFDKLDCLGTGLGTTGGEGRWGTSAVINFGLAVTP